MFSVKGWESFKQFIDLDHFAIDLHFFFKYSAARCEDYEGMETKTDVTVISLSIETHHSALAFY